MFEKILGSLVVVFIIWRMSKDKKFDREDVNNLFEKLRILAGGNDQNVRESRQRVSEAISDLHREKGRNPTIEEVAGRLTTGI